MRRDTAEMPSSWHRVDVPLSRRAVREITPATCHRFILSLKGTQFLSGLSKLVLLCTDFACLCGPCVPVSASERTRGFRPYFVVRSIGERVNTGYDLHDAALRGFLQRKCIGGEMV